MKREILVALLLSLSIGLAAAPAALAQGNCTMQSLAGTYVFESKGSSALVTGPAPGIPNHLAAAYAPAVIVGRFTIAADGTADGFYWGILGTGNTGLEPVPWHADITGFEDCSGIISYIVPVAGMGMTAQVREQFVVVDGGKGIRSVTIELALLTDPPTPLTSTWQTTARRVNTGTCGDQALRGDWVITCQSLHPLGAATPIPGVTHVAEAAIVRVEVDAGGMFAGLFETKIGPVHATFPVSGSMTVGGACTVTAEMQSPAAPGIVTIVKGVLFGKESLMIPLATTDGTDTWLGIYDTCRAIRRDR